MNQFDTVDLLRATVGRTLRHAMRELGCPALTDDLLAAADCEFLHRQLQGLPAAPTALSQMFAKAAKNGKVLRVGVSPEGANLFTVRLSIGRGCAVATLAYYRDQWSLHRLDAAESRIRRLSRPLLGALFGAASAAVVALLVITGTSATTDVVAEAEDQGYIVLTQAQYDEQLRTATETAATPTTKPNTTKPTTNLSFTLRAGMTTSDLTAFLKEKGLISDKAAFNQELIERGVDRRLQQKTYTFRSGMTEEELYAVLTS